MILVGDASWVGGFFLAENGRAALVGHEQWSCNLIKLVEMPV